MVKTIQRENLIKINKDPVVVFPLEKWIEVEETIENLKEAVRFNAAYKDTRGKKTITLEKLKEKHNLK